MLKEYTNARLPAHTKRSYMSEGEVKGYESVDLLRVGGDIPMITKVQLENINTT